MKELIVYIIDFVVIAFIVARMFVIEKRLNKIEKDVKNEDD